MARVLLTGMSGAGKSPVLGPLLRRGATERFDTRTDPARTADAVDALLVVPVRRTPAAGIAVTDRVRHGGAVDGFAHKPVLTGERVVLRPYRPSDLGGLAAAMADRDVLRLTGSVHSSDEPAPEIDDTVRAWYATRADQTDRLDLMVVDRAQDRCVGEVVLNEYDRGNRSCNLRIMIGPEGQNRGLGSESIRLLLDHAFAELPLHRIGLEVYEFNPRARRVYERSGFVVEGRRRDALCFDGQWVDAIVMAVLSTDPRPAGVTQPERQGDPNG